MKPGTLLVNLIKKMPAVTPQKTYSNEKSINPAYCDIDHCTPLCPDEKRIWVLRSDLILAVGIKNIHIRSGNTNIFDKVDDSVRHYIDAEDRYGHPSLAMPENDYDGSGYYAGWLYQHASHIEVIIYSGRYQNNKITQLQQEYLERYISIKFMQAFGEQPIIFTDFNDEDDIYSFLNGISFRSDKYKRTYSRASIENKKLLDIAMEHHDDPLAIALFEAGADISPAKNGKYHAIHLVARNGLLHHVKTLVERAPELVNLIDGCNQTPLVWAASRGHNDVMDFLITKGADVNLATELAIDNRDRDNHNNSHLNRAIKGAHATTILTLIRAGVTSNHTHEGDAKDIQLFITYNQALLNKEFLNQIDKNGYTPLHYAAQYGHMDFLRLLIAGGVDLNVVTPAAMGEYKNIKYSSMTAMDIVLDNQEHDALAILLLDSGANVSAEANGKTHVIHVVAKNGLLHRVKTLVERYPQLVHARDQYNQTPLLWAVSIGHYEIVDYLIAQGADVNLATQLPTDHVNQTEHNYSPLDWAINGEYHAIISTLINAEARANHVHSMINGELLLEAIKDGDLKRVQFFIKNNIALLNKIDGNGFAPLHYAAYEGHIEITRYLIAEGADVNIVTPATRQYKFIKDRGMTAMDIMLDNQTHDAIGILLLESGANILPAVNGKFHAIHLVARNGLLNHVKTLVERDPQLVHAKDDCNQTPLLWAASRGHNEVVEFLITKGADINLATELAADHRTCENHNNSPLDWAINGGHDATILTLIKLGAIANHTQNMIVNYEETTVETQRNKREYQSNSIGLGVGLGAGLVSEDGALIAHSWFASKKNSAIDSKPVNEEQKLGQKIVGCEFL